MGKRMRIRFDRGLIVMAFAAIGLLIAANTVMAIPGGPPKKPNTPTGQAIAKAVANSAGRVFKLDGEISQEPDQSSPQQAIPPEIESNLTNNTRELAKNFEKYATAAHLNRPDIIGAPFKVDPGTIVRLDKRSPQGLASNGGWFLPNPDKHDYNPENAITSHTNVGSGGSSNLVSASQDPQLNLALLNPDSPFFAPKDTLPDFWIDKDGEQHPLSETEETKWRWYVTGAGRINFTDDEWTWVTETVQGIGWRRYQYTNADPLTVVASQVVPEENEVLVPLFKAGGYRLAEQTADANRAASGENGKILGKRKTKVHDWEPMPLTGPEKGSTAGGSADKD
jgi:hypothetical protein